jgi:hypothetical protein
VGSGFNDAAITSGIETSSHPLTRVVLTGFLNVKEFSGKAPLATVPEAFATLTNFLFLFKSFLIPFSLPSTRQPRWGGNFWPG